MKKTLIFLALAATCLAAQAQNLGQFEWKLVPPAEAGMTQADPANGIAAAYFMAHSDGPRDPVNTFQETLYKSMGQQASGIPSDVRMTTLEFKENSNGEKLQMDFYRAAGDTQKRPTIIFSFGGGWAGGDRLIYREVAPRYVRHGINVAAIERAEAPSGLHPFRPPIHQRHYDFRCGSLRCYALHP